MLRKAHWNKRLAVAFSAGFLVLNTAVVLAAPVELSLNDAVMLALTNNRTIKIAAADREKAQWSVSEAKGGNSPSLSINHSDTRFKSYTTSSQAYESNKFSNTATLSLPLYTGGRVEANVEQAKWNLKVNDLSVDKSRQQVKLDATTGYFNVLQMSNVVKISQESVDMMVVHLKNVQAQYNVGVVAKSDVLRTEVELANDQQQLIIAQNNLDLAISNLNNVIGLPLETEITIKDELQHTKYELSLADSITYAMIHRTEAIQADYNIEVAKQAVKSAQSGNRVTVGANATTAWNDTKLPGTENNTWSVGLSANWNAFDSGVTSSKVKESDAAVEKAIEQAKQQKDTIQLQVRQAYLNMNEADKRIATTQVAVGSADEDFKIAGVRYSAGVGTNIDVIDAQVALNQAKNNYTTAMYDYNTSKANLDAAMGIAVSAKQ